MVPALKAAATEALAETVAAVAVTAGAEEIVAVTAITVAAGAMAGASRARPPWTRLPCRLRSPATR